jgi:hypothetical protein
LAEFGAYVLVAVVVPPVAARHDFPQSAATSLMVVALFQLALAAAFLLKRTPGVMLTAAAGAVGLVLAASWRWAEELISRMAW